LNKLRKRNTNIDDDIGGENETGGYINLFEREEQGVSDSRL